MTNATVQERQFEYEYPVIVGIDFGVYHSAVSFALRKDEKVLGVYGRNSRTTKTVSLYKRGSQEIVDWEDDAHRTLTGLWAKNYVLLSEFKLQLDETVNLPPLENNITPLKAITDYLRKLHENTVEELMDLPSYTSSDFQYWLTVPAHWSDRAKDTMRQAAIGAGFVKSSDPPRRLMFISEDEATAFFCAGSTDQVRFIAKDRLMIYRASEGKGVNLVMLEVSDSSAVQSQRWKEVARRHGTDCVSTSLDDNMRRFLEGKLRKYIDNLPANAMGKLMDTFRDSLKGNFLGIDDRYLPVPPGIGLDDNDLDAGLDGGYLVLSALELKAKVFEPVAAGVLEPIRTMLEQQRVRECKAVFMFGDLGVSQYLLERVRQEFRGQIGLVTVPMSQDAAIANGAVYAGLASYRTTVHSFHSPALPTSEALLYAPRLSSAKTYSVAVTSPSPGDITPFQPFNVGNNPYQHQRQNDAFHLQYQQQGFVQQQLYHLQTLQQQYQQQLQHQQQNSDANEYINFNMGGMGSELPLLHVPQATVSSGMATFDQGHIQGSGYVSGSAFNPTFTNGSGSGGVYTAGTTGGVYNTNGYNNSGSTAAFGYALPPAQLPILIGPGNNYYQQTLLPPETFSPSNSSSTPATRTNVQAQHVYPLVMAIDFGMKFSKVSYAAREDKGEMYDQYNWPHAAYQSEQTPVISLYKKGSTEIQDWGLKAREEMKSSPQDYYLLSNLRLQLDESIDVPPFGNGITPLKAITDYLKKLHEYVLLQWNMSFAEDRDSRHIQYCLTVPARWSIRSKNTMRQAAINAGMVQAGDPSSHLMLLSEDEVMATYCTRRIDGVQFKDKEQFIICNAGEGGGVDVVAFEVNEPAGQTRRLKEIARMRSENCGLDFLEANIETYLERKLRKFRGKIPAHGWEDCMSYFKYMQSVFSLVDEHCFLPIPEFCGMDSLKDLDIGLEDGMLCLPVEELKLEVFEPAVGDVLELIQDLMQSQQRLGGKGKAIFMLGEFGSCQYMLERARQEFKDHVELVAAPVRPNMAVSRGAVYMGLDS